jgi:hypothetical protein
MRAQRSSRHNSNCNFDQWPFQSNQTEHDFKPILNCPTSTVVLWLSRAIRDCRMGEPVNDLCLAKCNLNSSFEQSIVSPCQFRGEIPGPINWYTWTIEFGWTITILADRHFFYWRLLTWVFESNAKLQWKEARAYTNCSSLQEIGISASGELLSTAVLCGMVGWNGFWFPPRSKVRHGTGLAI